MRYVVADDWIGKLGSDAFCAWIRFHTWVDRTIDHSPRTNAWGVVNDVYNTSTKMRCPRWIVETTSPKWYNLIKGMIFVDKNKKETKGTPNNTDRNVKPEVIKALNRAHERYDQAFRNLRDR